MKNIVRILSVSALLTTGASALPFLAIGDGAEVFVTGGLGARADSNIFLSSKATSDTIFNIDPGLQLVFGKTSNIQGSWSMGESFNRYADHSNLNSELFSTDFSAGFDDGKSKGSVSANYNQSNQNSVNDVGPVPLDFLIRRNALNLGANGEISLTEKTSISSGVQYGKTDFKRAGFSDSESVTIPFNYYYQFTPKVDLSVGYSYHASWQQIGEDSKDQFFNVGARGAFTPKLSGQFNVGVTKRSSSHTADTSLLGIDSSLSYAATPKTSVQFGVNNNFDTNSQGQQQKNFAVHASTSTSISEQWSVTTALSYRAIGYYAATPSRVDDFIEAQIGASYAVSTNIHITGGFAYRTNKSDLSTSDFDNNVLSISATFRF